MDHYIIENHTLVKYRLRPHQTAVIIPDEVTTIAKYAFSRHANIRSLTIGDHVKTIERFAFPNKMNLEECIFPSNITDRQQAKSFITNIGVHNLLGLFIQDKLNINEVLKQELIKKITEKSFRTKILSKLIQENDEFAFAKMLSFIKKMPLNELDRYINDAESSTTIRIALLEYKMQLYPTEKLEEMENIQFEKSIGLRQKTLRDYREEFIISKTGNYYTIEGYKGCASSISLPSHINGIPVRIHLCHEKFCEVYLENGYTEINDFAFSGCENLENVIIPESVTEIGNYAFCQCINLCHISHNNNFKKDSFWDFTIPEGITKIGDSSFAGCRRLHSIQIPDSLISIGKSAFRECNMLWYVVFPNSVKYIGSEAFQYCSNLMALAIFLGENEYLCWGAFSNPLTGEHLLIFNEKIKVFFTKFCDDDTYYRVINDPESFTNELKNSAIEFDWLGISAGWFPDDLSENIPRIAIFDNIPYIGDDIFEGCKYLTDTKEKN